ncbi:MAG: TetR/AcrR family transcriptional regulator [Pseudodesulfovibrio sp.]
MSKAFDNYHRKRELITTAARECFAGKGFSAASMDDVAQAAGVTKQTVYRYFPSKIDLFRATLETCAEKAPSAHAFGTGAVDEELYGFALRFLRFHVSREYLDAIRLLMSEATRCAELGAVFHANGPKKTGALLAAFLRERIPGIGDADHAAFLFVSMLLNVRMPLLLGLRDSFPDEELDRHARYAVEVFLHGCLAGRSTDNPQPERE